MPKKTLRLDYQQKEEYIKLHLCNDLCWLLRAATEWSIQDQLKLEIDGYNVQVYAMDSVFLHARTLFEFFVKPSGQNRYSSDAYVGVVLISSNYSNNWRGPLNEFLMHPMDRSSPRRLNSADGPKDLNQMPVYFANEILRLWEEFEGELDKRKNSDDQKLKELARQTRKEAIEGADRVVNSTVAQQHAKDKGQVLNPVFVFVR
jgi:hypothetical protein